MRIVRQSLADNVPTLVFYRAMIGAGKTTLALAIASLLEHEKRTQLIYCCTVNAVRDQIAKLAYNMKLKFAIGCIGLLRS